MNKRLFALMVSMLTAPVVMALNINNTPINNVTVHSDSEQNKLAMNTDIKITEQRNDNIKNAKLWGITVKDWQRYRTYMQEQGKYFYQDLHLSPVDILAVTADSQSEMKRYTDIEVQHAHDRAEKELAHNVMFQQEYKRLYPNEKPLNPEKMLSFLDADNTTPQSGISLQANDELLLFVQQSNLLNYNVTHTLINEIKTTSNTTLSIYVVGKNLTNSDLQIWASANQVPASLVNTGRIHINPANNKYNPKVNHEPLPLVVLKRGNVLKQIKNI
ncbi:MAG: TIGR03759 family integrating conjugative element protein [Legionellales bacterium]|nr:TIGR03759 family integrating conjugative element protein [Legionellales bacterium]|tara:strand:+ start:2097 stop:2915 length:819 start_codon:yes stop_codon:yes gene_type:complete